MEKFLEITINISYPSPYTIPSTYTSGYSKTINNLNIPIQECHKMNIKQHEPYKSLLNIH